MKNNEVNINIIKAFYTLSLYYLSICLVGYINNNLLFTSITVIICTIVVFKYYKPLKKNKKNMIISIFTSLFFLKTYIPYNKSLVYWINLMLKNSFIPNAKTAFYADLLYYLIMIVAFPALLYLIYCFITYLIPKVLSFIKNLTLVEKKYILICLVVALFICSILSHSTTAFTYTRSGGLINYYDVIYTTDSGLIAYDDAWLNINGIENDMRQPFFAIMAMPFSLVAHFLSPFAFFIRENMEYFTIMQIMQFIILAIINILLARTFKIVEEKKKYFYLFISLTYPFMVFSLILEQYVICLFYLVLMIYNYFDNKDIKTNYLYIASVGAIITSGLFINMITTQKNIKKWFLACFDNALLFISAFFVFGKSFIIDNFRLYIDLYSRFFGHKIPFKEKLYQFTTFIKNIFFQGKGIITKVDNHPSYVLSIPTGISVVGIIIFGLVTLSMVINRKEKRLLVPYIWILFSIFILLILGWGTSENGLILYSLYFGWAYIIMFYKLIEKVFKNRLYKFVIISLAIVMLMFNLKEIYNVTSFAITYFR